MDWRVEDIRLFVEVLEHRSFTEAARRLKVPRSSVSRRIAALERDAGVRLLWRTTRVVQPTDVGAAFFEQCKRALERLSEAARVLQLASEAPRGHLRISAPPRLGPKLLEDVVVRYCALYPEVSVDVQYTDAVIDLRAEGFDVGLRIGPVMDELLVAKQVRTLERVLCATPEYLSAHGEPERPQALHQHRMLMFTRCADYEEMRLHRGGCVETIELGGVLSSNDFGLLLKASLAGQGIGVLTADIASSALEAGTLKRVLDEWSLPSSPVNLVYLGGPLVSRKLSAFLEMF